MVGRPKRKEAVRKKLLLLFMLGLCVIIFGVLLGEAIHYFALKKTMFIKVLWGYIPALSFLVYLSFAGACLAHWIGDWLTE